MNAINTQLIQPVPTPERTTARERLRSRVLTIVPCDAAEAMATHLNTDYEGLVVTGARRHQVMRKLRRAFQNLVLIAEPDSHVEHEASPAHPWYLPGSEDDGLLAGPSVVDILDGQRSSGASVTLLPSGYVEAGDVETLRAIVEAAKEIKGDDVALPLYLATSWLRPEHEQFLLAVIALSSHPVLLSFGSSTNPLDSKRKLAIYRRLVTGSGAFSWRTDLAGLDALAHGALGAAIGTGPGLRRFTPPRDKGKARRPDDPTPYVLSPRHMHWMKTGAMREELYVAAPAPTCTCQECSGQRIDRFTESQAAAAARHNHAIIDEYAQALLSAAPSERPSLWRSMAQDALIAHETTSAVVGRPWNVPDDVSTFAGD